MGLGYLSWGFDGASIVLPLPVIGACGGGVSVLRERGGRRRGGEEEEKGERIWERKSGFGLWCYHNGGWKTFAMTFEMLHCSW